MIVLDTHALVWWVSEPKRIAAKARRLVDESIDAGKPVSVSSISVWEIAMLVSHGRLEFTMDASVWIARVEALPFLTFIPVDNRIAVRAVQLENFANRDPADRIIIATAMTAGATLVTSDARMREYSSVKTIWD